MRLRWEGAVETRRRARGIGLLSVGKAEDVRAAFSVRKRSVGGRLEERHEHRDDEHSCQKEHTA